MGEGRPALGPELPENKAQPRPLVTPPGASLGEGWICLERKKLRLGQVQPLAQGGPANIGQNRVQPGVCVWGGGL